VYEAFDRKRNAIKKSTRRGSLDRRCFKQEFRALSELDNPNLVRADDHARRPWQPDGMPAALRP
jgi:hypothetical protein